MWERITAHAIVPPPLSLCGPTLTIRKFSPVPNRADDLPKGSGQGAMDWRQDIVMDSSKIRRELGYVEPTPFADGLERAVAWEASQPSAVDPE